MVSYRRSFISGGIYFFTVTLLNRKSTLLIDKIEILKSALNSVKKEHPFTLLAYVILPDHIHMLWKLPPNDKDYSLRWRKIKTQFSKAVRKSGYLIGKSKHNEYYLWQRRFWEHTIKNDIDLENHINYIHYNPIKHRLVTHLNDWPFSSFHYFVLSGRLSPHWATDVTYEQGIDLYAD